MKRMRLFIVTAMCALLLPGCYDQMNLEDTSLVLMIGLDVDENNNLMFYESSPVFYKEAKEKSEDIDVKSITVRDARKKSDAIVTGLTLGGKVQTILVSKRLIQQQEDWVRLLDTVYREPKQSLTSRMLIVDGPVGDVFEFKPKDKPRLSLHMKKLIDTANIRSITVSTNFQEFRHQMKDKGITPSITEIKKDKKQLRITGTSLLNKQGKYTTSLSLDESSLLLFLQNRMKENLSLTVPVGETSNGTDKNDHLVTVSLKKGREKIKTNYAENKFQYDITVKVEAVITSVNFEYDLVKQKTQLETLIAKEFQKELSALIEKCQENQIDPFGFGYYARAYQYPAWKAVQDHWGKTFAKAKVQITPEVEIKSIGVIE